MSLRPARSADAPAITAVFQAARDHSLGFLPNLHTDAEDHAFFAGVVARGEVTVAEADGAVVAFLRARRRRGRPPLRRIPTSTARASEPRCCAHAQAGRTRLELWVFQRNTGAIAFYEAHGFAIVEATDGATTRSSEPDFRMAWSLR